MSQLPKIQTVSFFGTCTAGSNVTLVSQHISSAFKIKRVRASFATGVNRTMTLKYFVSNDTDAPTTTEPRGSNILQSVGQVSYITGDGEFKDFEHEVINPERGAYIKVYAENADASDHTIDTQVTIEYIEENDK